MALLTAVITTRNEEDNIANCINAFDGFRNEVDIIVVDNASTDATKAIASELGAVVLDKGPERSAQRNLGWREAKSDYVVILDADMILPSPTINELLSIARAAEYDACWIREVRTGTGIRVKARNFERSFYDGTCIDALRLFSKGVLEKVGGYDEQLIAGPEDWDLDVRILMTGAKCRVTEGHLIHNEKKLSYGKMLAKKAYYTKSFAAYKAKWPNNRSVKKQFSPLYRFAGVFVENGKWRKLLAHPLLFCVVLFERFSVGVVYLNSLVRGKAST